MSSEKIIRHISVKEAKNTMPKGRKLTATWENDKGAVIHTTNQDIVLDPLNDEQGVEESIDSIEYHLITQQLIPFLHEQERENYDIDSINRTEAMIISLL